MLQQQVLVYVRRASHAQVRLCAIVAGALLLAFLVCWPLASRPLPRIDAFVPMIDSVLLFGDLVTATLLFAQATILRSRALIALAAGYLFSGFMIVPHALTFPGSFAAAGLLGAGVNTTVWLYSFWHLGLPVAVIRYAQLRKRDAAAEPRMPMKYLIATAIALSGAVALGLSLLAIRGQALLPPLMTDTIVWSPHLRSVQLVIFALLLMAMGLVWRGNRSLLDVWLLVALCAWALEVLLALSTTTRFSLGWYAGRIAGMLSGIFVLLALLIETSRLYTQLALSAIMGQRQFEARMISLDTVAASIAHQVKQPMAAMVTNAGAALIRLRRPDPDLDQIARILRSIVDDGHRAADIVTSVRTLFGISAEARQQFDLHVLIRDTLALARVELTARQISVDLALRAKPSVIVANRMQLQQVLLNIVTNAVEAISDWPTSTNSLTIRTADCAQDEILVEIADNGPGISGDAEQIFDAFFTTKAYGTGMGLPVCRSIVEAHGGRLWASPNRTEGAVFHIQIPRGEP
jgi:signal transduction histidine kinase